MCILERERAYNYKCLQVTKERDDMVSGEDISYFLSYQKIIPRFETFFNIQKSNPLIHCAFVVDIHLDFLYSLKYFSFLVVFYASDYSFFISILPQ